MVTFDSSHKRPAMRKACLITLPDYLKGNQSTVSVLEKHLVKLWVKNHVISLGTVPWYLRRNSFKLLLPVDARERLESSAAFVQLINKLYPGAMLIICQLYPYKHMSATCHSIRKSLNSRHCIWNGSLQNVWQAPVRSIVCYQNITDHRNTGVKSFGLFKCSGIEHSSLAECGLDFKSSCCGTQLFLKRWTFYASTEIVARQMVVLNKVV